MLQDRKLHRLLRLVVLTGVLALPAAPARADIIADFLKTIVGPLSAAIGGLNVLQSVMINIETRLPILMKTVELKNKEKLKNALAASKKKGEQGVESADAIGEFAGDWANGRCMQATGGQDQAMGEVVNQGLSKAAAQRDVSDYSGTGVPRGVTGKVPTVDPTKRAVSEYRQNVAQYATKGEAEMAAKMTGKTVAEILANPYSGASTEASTVLGTDSFNEDAHFVAAMSYCYALTGNSAIPYAQGRALSEYIDNVKQFNEAMSDYATQSVGKFFCFNPLYRKVPFDNKYAKQNADLKRQVDDFTQYSQSLNASDKARTPAQIDATNREYLLDPQSGGYVEVPAEPKKIGEPSLGAQHKLIKGQMVSNEQIDEAQFIHKWYSQKITSKMEGMTGIHLGNMYTTRLYKTQLLWRQYEDMEHQLLLEAIALARMVRQQTSDPEMVSPK